VDKKPLNGPGTMSESTRNRNTIDFSTGPPATPRLRRKVGSIPDFSAEEGIRRTSSVKDEVQKRFEPTILSMV
jgi:hypothetical protein